MASELRVDTLKDSSGNNSVGMSYVSNGSAKAWVNIEGEGTIAVRDSFNNSSITDRAAGKYTTTISSAMNNANYSAFFTGQKTPSTDDGYVMGGIGSNVITTTEVQITTQIGGSGPDDLPTVNVANHGDLA